MAATMEELIRALRFGKDAVIGAGENALAMGSGLVGQAVGGVNAMVPWMQGDLEGANRRLQEGEETFTYQPRTDVGRQMQHALGSRMEPIQKATQWAGENVADLSGSPVAGALLASTIEGAQNFLPGMEGQGAAAKAGTRAALRKPKIAPRYYSAVEAALEKPNARKVARPEVWKNWLLKQQEVRPEELKFRGLDELFEPGSDPNRLITRSEIQQHLIDNPEVITEKTLYDPSDVDILKERAAKKAAGNAPQPKTAHPLDLPESQWGALVEDRLQFEPGEGHTTVKDPVTGYSRTFSGNELTMGEDEMRRTVRRDLFANEMGYDQPTGGTPTTARRFEDEQIFPREPQAPDAPTQSYPESQYESYITESTRARKTPGGYREILFQHPAAEPYSQKHYGSQSHGLIGALRATEREITLPGEKKARPSFHAEEYQSDLHQAGQAKGYDEPRLPHVQKSLDEAHGTAVRNHEYALDKFNEADNARQDYMERQYAAGRRSYEFNQDPEYKALDAEYKKWNEETVKAQTALDQAREAAAPGEVPVAPWRDDRWLKQMVRRALRGAAEEGKDVFSWTPAEEQVTRWSDRYRKAYQNVYDKKARAYAEGELSNLMNQAVRAEQGEMRKPPKPRAGTVNHNVSVYSAMSPDGVSGWEITYPDGTTEFYPGGQGRNRVTAKTYATQKAWEKTPAVKAWALRLTPEMRKKLLERSIPYFGVAAGLEALDSPEEK